MKSEAHKSLPFYQLCASICAAALALGLAGCSSRDKTLDPDSPKAVAVAQAQQRISASELLAFCPTVTIREGTAVLANYGNSPDKTPENLVYQASLSDQTRSCKRDAGTMTMNVAVAGKVVPGPKFSSGSVTVPIRVAVIQGSDVLYSKLAQQPVPIGASNAATQFIFNDPNVSFPTPTAQNIQVFVGFDEGPATGVQKGQKAKAKN